MTQTPTILLNKLDSVRSSNAPKRPGTTPLQQAEGTKSDGALPEQAMASFVRPRAQTHNSIDGQLAPRNSRRPNFRLDPFGPDIASRTSPASPRSQTSRTSHASPPIPEFLPSPSVALDPVRTDYFQAVSRDRTSWRAATHLAAVIGGRVLITFGTGGLQAGFAPNRAIGPGVLGNLPPASGTAPAHDNPGEPILHYIGLGIVGTLLGALIAQTGIVYFARDTAKLGPRRAYMMGSISSLGLYSVLTAAIVYVYGQAQRDLQVRYVSLLPQIVGNFCLFYAITNSFPASEIVHGNTPLANREQTRLCAFAIGGASMLAYALLTSGSQNAPIWAREICKAAGISGLHLGASLGRTDALRWQSENRFLQETRLPSFSSPFTNQRWRSTMPELAPAYLAHPAPTNL